MHAECTRRGFGIAHNCTRVIVIALINDQNFPFAGTVLTEDRGRVSFRALARFLVGMTTEKEFRVLMRQQLYAKQPRFCERFLPLVQRFA